MARTPNYSHERADRDRAKRAKKDAKMREREDAAVLRKAEQAQPPTAPATESDAKPSRP